MNQTQQRPLRSGAICGLLGVISFFVLYIVGLPGKGFAVAVSVIAIGMSIAINWDWRSRLFYIFFAGLGSIHLIFIFLVPTQFREGPAIFILPLVIIEIFVVTLLLEKLLQRSQ